MENNKKIEECLNSILELLDKTIDVQNKNSWIDWDFLFQNYEFSEEFLTQNWQIIRHSAACRFQKISLKMIEDEDILINWLSLSMNPYLTEDVIMKYAEYWDWDSILKYHKLSEELLIKVLNSNLKSLLNVEYVCIYQTLSENFIRQYLQDIDNNDCWHEIGIHQQLSKSFIIEFADKLEIHDIIIYQNIDGDIIKAFAEKIKQIIKDISVFDFNYFISQYQSIPHLEEIINEIIEENTL